MPPSDQQSLILPPLKRHQCLSKKKLYNVLLKKMTSTIKLFFISIFLYFYAYVIMFYIFTLLPCINIPYKSIYPINLYSWINFITILRNLLKFDLCISSSSEVFFIKIFYIRITNNKFVSH